MDGLSRWRLASSDMDHARQEMARFFAPSGLRLDTAGGFPFRLELDVARVGALLTGSYSFTMPLTTAVENIGGYQVTLATAGTAGVRHNHDEVGVDRHRAAVIGPGRDVTFRHGADFRPLAVVVDEQALHAELSAMLGRPVTHRLVLPPALDVTHGPAASWCRLVRLFRDESVAKHSLLEYPLIAERLRYALIDGMLLCLPHNFRDDLDQPPPPAPPRAIRRVTDTVNERPERPFTVAELAAAGHLSVRSLQDGFRRHLGLTPMAYVRQVRLGRAHAILKRAAYGEVTVAAVAHRCGFAHLGRFSSEYRARYGESPSDTLRAGD
ncbi:AraC family transcriptional regulator [Actinoplanes sp. NPDC048988]|uniref:helix-turn-helix transcriptional regulator n=1 Tax=Actinoplanes sp. NPDC048988 TaxID=3363901 RepID=UPI003721C1CF